MAEADNDIDPEALQAQVALSMSFADSLVSSWLKPATAKLQRTHKDLESELKEHMRRPARLGVGASVPQATSLTREQVKLKQTLTGKKRAHDDANEAGGAPAEDGEDEDSRGKAVQKRARLDPFSYTKKKKKAPENPLNVIAPSGDRSALAKDNLQPVPSLSQTLTVASGASATDAAPTDGGSSPSDNLQRKKKKKNKAGNAEVSSSQSNVTPAAAAPGEPAVSSINEGGVNRTPEERVPETPSTTIKPIPSTANEVIAPCDTEGPSAQTSPTSKKGGVPAAVLKQPLLNLDGPPHLSETEGEDDQKPGATPASASKKRRKRKKKKQKNSSVAAAAGG